MLTPDPIRTAARRQKRLNKLTAGGRAPVCFRCGHSDIEALEQHHYVNHVHHPDLTVNVCRNCHRSYTEQLEAVGVPTDYPSGPAPLDTLTGFLGGLAVLLSDVSRVLLDWCHWIKVLETLNPGGINYPRFTPGQPRTGTAS